MHITSAINKTINLALQPEETVLWSYRRAGNAKKTFILCTLAALFWFGCFTAFAYWAYRDNELTPGTLNILSLFIVWGIVTLAVAPFAALTATQYVITNRRVLSVTVNRMGLKPAVISLPLCEQLVFSIKRHRDGSADYLMFEQQTGKTNQAEGFKRVSDTAGLEAALRESGVSLPETDNDSQTAFRITKYSPMVKMVLLALGLHLVLGVLAPGIIRSSGAEIYLYGERADATVVGVNISTRKKGRRIKRNVTRHYPILRFRTREGKLIQAKGFSGDKQPTWQPKERVSVLYLPDNPEQVMRDNDAHRWNALLFCGLFMAIALWLVVEFTRNLLRWNRSRKNPFYLIEPLPVAD